MGGRKQRSADMRKTMNALQDSAASSLDSLAEYEEFREMFLPAIRKALLKGWSGETILKHFKPIMMARLVQLGAIGGESASLTAIKEILDRTDGKAVQKTENIHKLGKLPDEELDAILATKVAQLQLLENKAKNDEID